MSDDPVVCLASAIDRYYGEDHDLKTPSAQGSEHLAKWLLRALSDDGFAVLSR